MAVLLHLNSHQLRILFTNNEDLQKAHNEVTLPVRLFWNDDGF